MVSLCFVEFSVGMGFCHRTESDLFLFPFATDLRYWTLLNPMSFFLESTFLNSDVRLNFLASCCFFVLIV